LDVTLVLKEGAAWVLAILAALVPVLAVLTASWSFFSARLDSIELYALSFGSILTGLCVLLLRDVTSRLLDRVFYRTRVNFQDVVRNASTWLTKVLNLDTLLRLVVETISESLAVDNVGVYVKHTRGDWYAVSRHSTLRCRSLSGEMPDWLRRVLETRIPAHMNPSITDEFEAPREEGGVSLVVPIVFEDVVGGCITLGTKKSGDPFYPHDIDLLSTLANQAGVAIRNAQLYEQVALVNEHLRNIVSTIESGVVAVNEAERVTMFNSAAERLSGLASEEMVGRQLADLPAAVADSLRMTLTNGLPRVVPDVELARVGSAHPVPVICCTSPLRGPTGGLLGAVAVFSDLTPLKELETERQRAERLAYFETLAAGIAHEIKNPLVAIKTFLQLLPQRFSDAEFREEFGRVAGREIERMEHLVARLRSLATPRARTHHPVDLRAPVNDALELLQPRLEEKTITSQWDPGPQPCLVMGDHAELEQLFLNLFINALEAMAPGGMLTVRLTSRETSAAVEVEDTGPGIRDDLLGKIFDPFVTTKRHGSGLGLAICSSIASAHRARLRAGNKAGGRGAIFTVELPLGVQVVAPVNA
jgi:PAS domain S-box-containing protein